MTIFQIKFNIQRTAQCPPSRAGFCVPKRYSTTKAEYFDDEEKAMARYNELRTKRRTPEGTVTSVHIECFRRKGLLGLWDRIRDSHGVSIDVIKEDNQQKPQTICPDLRIQNRA